MPFKPRFNITPKINKILLEIERVRGFLEAVKLKDDWMIDMRKKALIYVMTKSAADSIKHFTVTRYCDIL